MGGNKSGKTSSDLLPLYLDKYKTNNAPPISDEEREDLIAEMAAINATLAAQNKE